ncbi:MAG: T9SS type A sorting domain-containing protein [Bacteroidetes bacterium]|nr:T9SS type A sorting domain-containing protein [Bacteroidota bacterium]
MHDGSEYALSVYNAMGNLIESRMVTQSPHALDLTGYGSGFYFIKAHTGNNVQMKKIVVR